MARRVAGPRVKPQRNHAAVEALRSAAGRAVDFVAPALRKKPDFLVIGTQKAGTTSLHAYLASHPRIAPARGPKELHFFNLYYERGLRWYLSHFPWRPMSGGQLRFEATPDYLGCTEAPARVRASIGRTRLIAVLRDPAERAYSAWNMWHSFAERADRDPARADRRTFAQAIEDELASPTQEAHLHFHYVRTGHYAEHLERWLCHFSREDMLVLEFAEMANDLPAFLDKICLFLGICSLDEEAARCLAQTRHWVGPQRSRTPEDEATIARLKSYYKAHDQRLAALLGRNPR